MKILTAEGKVVEGEPLTEAVAHFIENAKQFMSEEGIYISIYDFPRICKAIFKHYELTLKPQAETTSEEV